MIPRIRAIAIDDNLDHLEHIQTAARNAAIGCLPIHFPGDATAENFAALSLAEARIRIVITDLHLTPGSETASPKQVSETIANLLHQLKLSPWTPYVLVLWTRYADELDGLRLHLEDRLPVECLPALMVALDKGKYGIGNQDGKNIAIDHESLWQDLRSGIQTSKGVNLLLQWESEVLKSADGVACSLIKLARRDPASGKIEKKVSIDAGVDRVVSLIARTATSFGFASENPRSAANEGLIPLLADEMQHLGLDDGAQGRWAAGMSERTNKSLSATPSDISFFNDAFLISRDGAISGTHRGAVLAAWHNEEQFVEIFGKAKAGLKDVFGLGNPLDEHVAIKYVQIEGLCDSAQQKPGMVPFVLACEIPADMVVLPMKTRPVSIEVSPTYRHDDESEWKLVVNLRYYFTASRESAKARSAEFRIRESLIAKWAFTWANHAIRPGIVSF